VTVYVPDPSYTEESYAGPATVAASADHAILSFNVFRTPEALRGAVLFCNGGGFRASSLPSTIDDSVTDDATNYFQRMVAEFLRRGFDVFLYAVPPARDSAANPSFTGNPVVDTVFDIDTWEGTGVIRLGDAYARGHGMVYLSESSSPSLPADYAGPLHPMQDPARINWMSGHVMAMQYVAANRTALGWASVPLIAFGGSATAVSHGYTVFGPDRAPFHFPGGAGQDAQSTRGLVDVAMLNAWQTWWPAWVTSVYLSGVANPAMSAPNWATGQAYPTSVSRLRNGVVYRCYVAHTSGASTEAGIGASWQTVWFANDLNIQATTIASAAAGTLAAWSALSWLDLSGVLADNRNIPTLLHYSDGTTLTTGYDKTTVANAAVSTHDDYFGAAAQLVLGKKCMLMLNNPQVGQAAAFTAAGVQHQVVAAGAANTRNVQFAWLEGVLRQMAGGGVLRPRAWRMPSRRAYRLLRLGR